MRSTKHSFLDGNEWVLRTRVQRRNESGITLTHDATLLATTETRARWNEQFWRLFPGPQDEFHALVTRGEINVKVMFRFRPTARMKQRYGGLPVLKIARTAENWHGRLDRLAPALANAIDAYERDKRMLDQQRHQAWLELIYLRLPHPPPGYKWELTTGDPRFYGDLLNFQLQPCG
ncbi:MAG: hypothetical protein ACT443_06010 [Gemmatimonadota bacterium]